MNATLKATIRNSRLVKAAQPFLLLALFAAAGSGCAGPKAATIGPVFFPPAPDEPRVQYLMGIEDSTDIEGKPASFSLLAGGGASVVRKIGKPYGLTAHGGKLYVCSSSGSQVIIIDFVNKKFEFLKGNVRGAGELKTPIGLAHDKEGNLYVADNGRNEVVVYDPQGNYLKSMGKFRDTQGKKSTTVGVAVHGDLVYVLDGRLSEIRVLDRNTGEQLRTMGSMNPEDVTSTLALPTNITVDDKGFVYVTNVAKANVMKFDADGHMLLQFGGHSNIAGGFSRPKGVAVDGDGWIYVADAGFSNVQLFLNDRSRMLGVIGVPGLPAGSLNLPAGVAVSTDNLPYFQKLAAPDFILEKIVFVSNQASSQVNSAISIYGVGTMKGSKKVGGATK